jgi:hypothetical protein
MKRLILLTIGLMLLSGAVYARRIAWVAKEKPPLSLADAIKLAETRLQEEKIQYFCIGASLAKTFSGGDWELNFSSKQGKQMTVSVGSDRNVRASEYRFDY